MNNDLKFIELFDTQNKNNTEYILAKILIFTIRGYHKNYSFYIYQRKIYKFSNGLILIPNSDYWLFVENESEVKFNGDLIESIKETYEHKKFTKNELLTLIQISIKESGKYSVPSKHRELWHKRPKFDP